MFHDIYSSETTVHPLNILQSEVAFFITLYVLYLLYSQPIYKQAVGYFFILVINYTYSRWYSLTVEVYREVKTYL
jgi:hypothetical protein